jgi:cytochrome b involved in lipid metabolism
MEGTAVPEKIITLAELRQHRDAKSLWLAISDTVYDVTKFMEEV